MRISCVSRFSLSLSQLKIFRWLLLQICWEIRPAEKYSRKPGEIMFFFGSRKRIGLFSVDRDSRNPINDKNLILNPLRLRGWPGSSDNVGETEWCRCTGCMVERVSVRDINENDDDHVLSVPVFGNRTSLRMMDDTLIVRIYAPHVPRNLLIFLSILRPRLARKQTSSRILLPPRWITVKSFIRFFQPGQ